MFERFSTAGRQVVFCARAEASPVGAKFVDTEHLLLGLLRVDPATLYLIAPSVTPDVVRNAAVRWHAPETQVPTSVDLPISDDLKLAFETAAGLADDHQCSLVRTEHLLLALMTLADSHATAILQESEASASRLQQMVSGLHGNKDQVGEPVWHEGLQLL